MDYPPPPIAPYGLGPSNRASMDIIYFVFYSNILKNVE